MIEKENKERKTHFTPLAQREKMLLPQAAPASI